jgi:hypothetical protein
MRDKQLLFGAMALATKDTTVYSADVLDMNTPATQYTGRMANAVVVFKADAAFAATDGYIPLLMHSDDNDTFTEVVRGPEVTAPAADSQLAIPIPVSHKRYLKAGAVPKSSTTSFTAKAVSAWIQLGA